jgi:hypothetical protein
MLQRIASILFIAITLMSFAASTSFSQDDRRPERRVYVGHRHVQRRHVVVLRRHRHRSDIKVKVNL